jgi:hypothetical protein
MQWRCLWLDSASDFASGSPATSYPGKYEYFRQTCQPADEFAQIKAQIPADQQIF